MATGMTKAQMEDKLAAQEKAHRRAASEWARREDMYNQGMRELEATYKTLIINVIKGCGKEVYDDEDPTRVIGWNVEYDYLVGGAATEELMISTTPVDLDGHTTVTIGVLCKDG